MHLYYTPHFSTTAPRQSRFGAIDLTHPRKFRGKIRRCGSSRSETLRLRLSRRRGGPNRRRFMELIRIVKQRLSVGHRAVDATIRQGSPLFYYKNRRRRDI